MAYYSQPGSHIKDKVIDKDKEVKLCNQERIRICCSY